MPLLYIHPSILWICLKFIIVPSILKALAPAAISFLNSHRSEVVITHPDAGIALPNNPAKRLKIKPAAFLPIVLPTLLPTFSSIFRTVTLEAIEATEVLLFYLPQMHDRKNT